MELTCNKCGQTKSESDFQKSTERGKVRRRKQCKACASLYMVEYQKKYPDRRQRKDRAYHLRKSYGITIEDYDALIAAQNDQCAICETAEGDSTGRRLHVDHCHETGKIRGLLCYSCNRALGVLNSPQLIDRAKEYMTRSL